MPCATPPGLVTVLSRYLYLNLPLADIDEHPGNTDTVSYWTVTDRYVPDTSAGPGEGGG